MQCGDVVCVHRLHSSRFWDYKSFTQSSAGGDCNPAVVKLFRFRIVHFVQSSSYTSRFTRFVVSSGSPFDRLPADYLYPATRPGDVAAVWGGVQGLRNL